MRLLRNLGYMLAGLFIGGLLVFGQAHADNLGKINLPQLPSSSTGCAAGTISTLGGSCATPKINDTIEGVIVTAPRLDPQGNPISTPTPSISGNVGGTTSGSCINVPSGWGISGTGQNCTLVPPSTASVIKQYYNNVNAGYVNDFATARQNGINAEVSSSPRLSSCGWTTEVPNVTPQAITGTGYQTDGVSTCSSVSFTVTTVNGCPSGYSLNGSSCQLSNASAVQKPTDGQCTIVRTNNSFSGDPNDPDCSGSGSPAGNPVSQSDSKGKHQVQANSDGSTTIISSYYNYNNSTTTTTTVNYNSAGVVTGVTSNSTQGVGTANTGQTANSSSSNGATSSDISGLTNAVNGASSQAHSDAGTAHIDAQKLDQDMQVTGSTSSHSLPNVPQLYTTNYPDGLSGIWNTHKQEMLSTPLGQLTTQLVPNFGDSGQCPSWDFNFNLGNHMNFGTLSLSPPCWIWNALSAIFIVTALFVARGLIFGG